MKNEDIMHGYCRHCELLYRDLNVDELGDCTTCYANLRSDIVTDTVKKYMLLNINRGYLDEIRVERKSLR